jgi:two-component system OmpR family response regulator
MHNSRVGCGDEEFAALTKGGVMRVLLVEDDRMIGAAVAQALKDAAYAVDWVTDGGTAIEAAAVESYDLVLLDLGLPKPDGLDVLRRFRKTKPPLPVIIVTARDRIEDRIGGLDLGADDYIVKPFEIRELLARMRAIVRRKGSGASPLLSNGVITLDPASHEASHAGTRCQLTAREFALLHALLSRPGTIMSRGDLERQIYGWNEETESNAVEFLIHAIRKKIGATAIRNVRGVGWMVDRPQS